METHLRLEYKKNPKSEVDSKEIEKIKKQNQTLENKKELEITQLKKR